MKFAIAIAQEALPQEPVLLRGNIIQSMEKAKSMGYDAVEIHTRDAKLLDANAIENCSRNASIGIAALATGMAKRIDGLSFIHDSTDIRKQAVERVMKFIDLAAKFNSTIIIGSLRGAIPDLANRGECDRRFRECMEKVLAAAESKKVDIVLEVINRYENNFLNTAAETIDYIKPFDSKRLKIHLDTFHMNIEETSMVEAIRLCGARIGWFHVADNTRLYPGSGTIDFPAVFKALEDVGYQGYISLECLAQPDGETAGQKAVDYLNSIYTRSGR